MGGWGRRIHLCQVEGTAWVKALGQKKSLCCVLRNGETELGWELFLQRKLRRTGASRWVYRALSACVEVGSKKIKTGGGLQALVFVSVN